MAERANITPSVLKWARESAKISEDVAASKVSIEVEKLREWENGTSQPTIRQAQKLAKDYKRPFALFFLPEPPTDFQPLQDFRKKDSRPLGTASTFIIRELQQKQTWVSDFYQENNEAKLPFVGKFNTSVDPKRVAKDILNTLQIDPVNYQTENPLLEWIKKAESIGIFISRTSFIHGRMVLDSDEMQGFAIADHYAPFIFINSEDWPAPQLFTLVHELVHIWIAASGISNEVYPYSLPTGHIHPVELFCNEVAASALLPEEFMRKLDPGIFLTHSKIYPVSRKLGISTFSFLVRAYKLGIITLTEYRSLRETADSEFKKFVERENEKKELAKARAKEKEGGPSTYMLRVLRNGKLFTQVVIDSYRGGLIEPSQASTLLNTQVTRFPKLLAQLY